MTALQSVNLCSSRRRYNTGITLLVAENVWTFLSTDALSASEQDKPGSTVSGSGVGYPFKENNNVIKKTTRTEKRQKINTTLLFVFSFTTVMCVISIHT